MRTVFAIPENWPTFAPTSKMHKDEPARRLPWEPPLCSAIAKVNAIFSPELATTPPDPIPIKYCARTTPHSRQRWAIGLPVMNDRPFATDNIIVLAALTLIDLFTTDCTLA